MSKLTLSDMEYKWLHKHTHTCIKIGVTWPARCWFTVCVFDEPTDIVFVVDEKEGGPETMNNIWKFIKDLLHYVDMSNGNVNVKFIYECIDIPDVQLGSYRNKTALMSALNRLAKHPRSTADLLQHMSYRLLGSDINAIEPHHKVGVYITDGASGNLSATLNEAQTAKLLHNIELFGVGIGKDIDPTELRALVSCEVDKHLHMVIKPEDLDDVVHPVIRELCKGEIFTLYHHCLKTIITNWCPSYNYIHTHHIIHIHIIVRGVMRFFTRYIGGYMHGLADICPRGYVSRGYVRMSWAHTHIQGIKVQVVWLLVGMINIQFWPWI